MANGFYPPSVNTDCSDTSEQNYIDALRAYTHQHAAQVARLSAPSQPLRPPSAAAAAAAAAAASPPGAATTPAAATLPFAIGQWPRPEDLIGLGLEGADARVGVRSNGAGHGVRSSDGGGGSSSGGPGGGGGGGDAGHVDDTTHAFGYINGLPGAHDAAYHISPELSMSPLETNSSEAWSTSPSSAAPSLAFSPFTSVYQTGGMADSAPSYQGSSKQTYGPAPTVPPPTQLQPDRNAPPPAPPPALSRMPPTAPVIPPITRSPLTPVAPSMPGATKESYGGSAAHSRLYLPQRNPGDMLGSSPRSPHPKTGPGLDPPNTLLPSSPSSTLPAPSISLQPDQQAAGGLAPGPAGPPLQPTTVFHQIVASGDQVVMPDIQARIDKGFFLYDHDWTCYRRNYFSVACAYTLRPPVATAALYLKRTDGLSGVARIGGFAMCISAAVEDTAGKAVELIQHTPKRDKGPQHRPERVRLAPHPDGSLTLFPGALAAGRIHHEYDHHHAGPGPGASAASTAIGSASSGELQTVAQFERIQFKSATANNGKRRAAQQYYHLIVDLFAEVSGPMGGDRQWVKVAERASAPVVVRGRSPGHYQDDRRGSSSSMGPRGPGSADQGGRVGAYAGPSRAMPGFGNTLSVLGGASHFGGRHGGGGGGFSYHGAGEPLSPWQRPLAHLDEQPRSSGSPDARPSNRYLDLVGAASADRLRYRPYPSPPLESRALFGGRPGPRPTQAENAADYLQEAGRDDSSWPPPRLPDLDSPAVPWHLGCLTIRDHLRSTSTGRDAYGTPSSPGSMRDALADHLSSASLPLDDSDMSQ